MRLPRKFSIALLSAAIFLALLSRTSAEVAPPDDGNGGNGPGPNISVEEPAGNGLVNGAAVNFGNVTVETTSTKTITLRNNGTGPVLTINPIVEDGPDSSYFTIDTTGTNSVWDRMSPPLSQ